MIGILENLTNLINSYRLSNKLKGRTPAELISYFESIEFGASFNPEHDSMLDNSVTPLQVLDFIINNLGVKKIRLAFRWNVIENNNKFSLSYHKEILDFCMKNNVELTLNLGPIKTMRWPEEHIPEDLKAFVNYKDIIELDSPIVKYALEHLRKLCEYIKLNYADKSQNIKIIQCNNEFQNRFGVYKFIVSPDFEVECINIAKSFFPNSKILLNSNGLLDVNPILKVIKSIPNTNFIVGINYYYKVGGQNKIPLYNKIDGLFLSKIPYFTPRKLRYLADKYKFETEVCEFQGESWLPDAPTPGNSFKEFLFELFRVQIIKPKDQKKLLARYWGIEDIVSKVLSKKGTQENSWILELISYINTNKGLTI